MTAYCSQPRSNRLLSQFLIVGALTAIGLLSGLTPELSKDSGTLVFSTSASAQAVSDQELRNYVSATVEVEMLRQNVYGEIKRLTGGNVPSISSCSEQGLPDNVARIWQRFCQQSEAIIQKYGLSNGRFNAINRMRQGDQDLERRIREEANRRGR